MFEVDKIRQDFPALSQKVYGKSLIYLDNAATTQKPQVVIDAVNEMNNGINGNIHRGIHYLSSLCTERYEAARETVQHFLHAAKKEEIVLTSGTTAAINLVAFSFGERYIQNGDEILISEAEHHSNIVPWQLLCKRKGAKIKVLPIYKDGGLAVKQLPQYLSPKTKLCCITQMSNVLGIVNPIKEIVSIAHTHQVPVLVDGAQGIVHQDIDVQDIDCDFYVFSGHKLYGPTGTGILYGKEKWLDAMPPYQGGGDMIASVSFEQTTYAELPLKFEAGTANYIGAHGLKTAIDYLNQLGLPAIQVYEQSLLNYALQQLLLIEGLQIYGTATPKSGLVSFNIKGLHPADTAMLLDKMGIAARSGHLCAQPLMQRFGIQSMLRLSFSFYNTKEEIDKAVTALVKARQMLIH
ncbi:MAG: SufS family cysteine desulfurase [Prevotellaceae bacterium]|jgi:cysteine desulfurase/selenocysteine lyase|nr:SufS family cysteine desulfurase [Prevotellaceae bacterium]